ncbi:helix-turn-helix transcriptional regulator [Actinosynnema sp. NPDC020468]|uniref:helix-turn-helix domain-containing protein n=1 Tax=Actinosynnema sp. NPDC020468 TaxID=3154488 RepID=UPI0033D39A2B
MRDHGGLPDDVAESLIDNSSFGTSGARSLGARTPVEVASGIVSNVREHQREPVGARRADGGSQPVAVADGDDPAAVGASWSHLAREELSRGLRRLRTEARMTGTAAARATGMSQSKLSKIENGLLLPSVRDVEKLLAELSAARGTRVELLELARRLHDEAEERRVVLHRGAHRHEQTVARIEALATTGRFFRNAGVPALAHSEGYLRAVLGAASSAEQVAASRSRRAQLDDLGKRFVFLLTEGALRWRVGGAEVMCEQLAHLRDVARRPNVELGVIPWAADARFPAPHGFQVYDERVVVLSVLTGSATITDPRDVREYLGLFARLERLAVRGEAAEDLLEAISDDHRELG